jgi:hypothetical protein
MAADAVTACHHRLKMRSGANPKASVAPAIGTAAL